MTTNAYSNECNSLLEELNQKYIQLHHSKEEAFWAMKMALKSSVPGEFAKREAELKRFATDGALLEKVDRELARTDLSSHSKVGLEGWSAYFKANTLSSQEAIEKQEELIALEEALTKKLSTMKFSYTDPTNGKVVEGSTVKFRGELLSNPNEATRKAAYGALLSYETAVLANGFIELIQKRNAFARSQGFSDYYAWKVQKSDRMSKETLFNVLEDLEEKTRDRAQAAMDQLAKEKGNEAMNPWNFDFFAAGDVIQKTDPYLQFENAFGVWGQTFANLGVKYRNAEVQVDMVDRKGKYPNGFMHAPLPSYVDQAGVFHPTAINLTSNAVPSQAGSGYHALQTLAHEFGHTAHFSNITMPSPAHSQEFSPTSMPFAEVQSMFMDTLMRSPEWLFRYAKNAEGKTIPVELVKEMVLKEYRFLARDLRWMMTVPFFEKALYEMSDKDLTVANILQTARRVEKRLVMTNGAPRPLLTVVHLLSSDSAAQYHGYLLAQMGVYQTRDHFTKKYGYILDNPQVGPEMNKVYWEPGNSISFTDYIKRMTGNDFSAEPTIAQANKTPEQVSKEIDEVYSKIQRSGMPHSSMNRPIDLDLTISIVHGDELIATTKNGDSFEDVNQKFKAWIRKLVDLEKAAQ